MIAAASENNALGKNNELVWRLPNDFKGSRISLQDIILLWGENIRKFSKPLPNRTHIVISRQDNYNPEGCIVVSSMEKAAAICPTDQHVYIIGGKYNLGISFRTKLNSRVHQTLKQMLFPRNKS
jgi:dihydrofolate reductase